VSTKMPSDPPHQPAVHGELFSVFLSRKVVGLAWDMKRCANRNKLLSTLESKIIIPGMTESVEGYTCFKQRSDGTYG
jgi:hypothetical protein